MLNLVQKTRIVVEKVRRERRTFSTTIKTARNGLPPNTLTLPLCAHARKKEGAPKSAASEAIEAGRSTED